MKRAKMLLILLSVDKILWTITQISALMSHCGTVVSVELSLDLKASSRLLLSSLDIGFYIFINFARCKQ